MIAFACAHCGQDLQVQDVLAGKSGRCPQCGKSIAVPSPSLTNAVSQARSAALVEATAGFVDANPAADEEYDFLAPPQGPGEMGRLGGYRVLKVLGAGGMGVVFLAEDLQLKRRVALKAIKPGQGSGPAKQRFVREAQATAKLKHDHVVTIYQVGEDRGAPFLAMEFLQGEPLDARLKREGKLPILEAIRIARETAEGLAAAHEAGLVHRDIKPGNLWLEAPKGRVKVLDFGLARGGTEDIQITQSGTIIGTPAFMAPEQAQGKNVDARADLFSVGCVLYRMVTGELPFQGPDTISTLLSVSHDTPMPPQERNPAVPAALADFIVRLLAKKPEERPPTAAAVAEELASLERAREDTAMISAAEVQARAGRKALGLGRRGLAGLGRLFLRMTWKQRLLFGGGLLLLLLLLVLMIPSGPKSGAEKKDTTGAPPPGPGAPVMPSEREKPFVLRRKAGGIGGEFKSLSLVLPELADGDVIEVHGNGPFSIEGINHTGRSLIVKAAPGYRPRFNIKGQIKVEKGAFHWQGCDLWSDSSGLQDVNFRGFQGDWVIRDCRIYIRGSWPVAFDFHGAKFTILDSLISDPESGSLVYLGPRTKFEMSNSIVNHGTAHLNLLALAPPGGQQVQLRNNTIRMSALVAFPRPKKEYTEAIRADSEGNLQMDGGVFWESPAEVKPLLNWNGRRNLYIALGVFGDGKTWQDLAAWNKFWGRDEEGSRLLPMIAFRRTTYLLQSPAKVREEVQTQVEELRLRHKELGDFGPNWDLVGPGPAYLKALQEAAQPIDKREAPAEGPVVLVRAGKMVRGFGNLQSAVNGVRDGDIIEIRSDGEFAGCVIASVPAGMRRLSIRAAPGYTPTIAGNQGIHFDSGNELTVEGLRFRNGGLVAEARQDGRFSRIARVANCSFEGQLPDAPLGMPCRLMAGDVKEGGPRLEVVNCLLTAAMEWNLNPGRTLTVQNSVVGTIWIWPVGGGIRRLELNRCVVWPAGDVFDRAILTHAERDQGQVTVEARGTLFGGISLASGDAGTLTGWKGERNAFRFGLRNWVPLANTAAVFSLDELRQRYVCTENGSVAGDSYLDDPRQWQVTGPPDVVGFGADVNRVARTLPAEKK